MTNHDFFRILNAKASYKWLTCTGLVLFADFLFYGQSAGWTLGLFSILLLLAVLCHNEPVAQSRSGSFIALLVFGLTLALVEVPTVLAAWMVAITMIALVIAPKLAGQCNAVVLTKNIGLYGSVGWICLYRDSRIVAYASKRWHKRHSNKTRMA